MSLQYCVVQSVITADLPPLDSLSMTRNQGCDCKASQSFRYSRLVVRMPLTQSGYPLEVSVLHDERTDFSGTKDRVVSSNVGRGIFVNGSRQ